MQKTLTEALSIQAWVANNFVGRFLDPLEPWQQRFLHLANFYQRPILANCCRGSGKSELAGIIATHTCIFRKDQTVLLASPAFTQSKELYRRGRRLYDKYESDSKPHLIADTKTGMELSNGSRLVVISGGNEVGPRSFRSNVVICDELAHCDRTMVESALIPSMAGVPGAKFIGISTPAGKELNLFYEWYVESAPDAFERIEVPADQSRRITKKFLAHMKAVTQQLKFDQEFFVKFISGGEFAYFPENIINACFVDMDTDGPTEVVS